MNRSERRKNPDQWWRVVAFARDEREIRVENGPPVYVRGDVDGVVVVQLPESMSTQGLQAAQVYVSAVERSLQAAGIENALIVPRGVEFVCLRPVSREQGMVLSIRSRGTAKKPEAPPETH